MNPPTLEPGEQRDRIDSAHGDFGYERSNPVPADGNWYCRRLTCPLGHPYWYHRLGSVGAGPDGHIVDHMELLCFGGDSHIELFFDMYHLGASSLVPSGLSMGAEAGRGTARGRFAPFPEGLEEYDQLVDQRVRHSVTAGRTLLKDEDWASIDGRLCLVMDFVPLAKMQGTTVVAISPELPYASVRIKCEKSTDDMTGLITHKTDFAMLWAAFNTRAEVAATRLDARPSGFDSDIAGSEEVWLVWTRKRYRTVARLLGPFLPRLTVMLSPSGALRLAVDDEFRPELQGMKRAMATMPILTWTPEVMS